MSEEEENLSPNSDRRGSDADVFSRWIVATLIIPLVLAASCLIDRATITVTSYRQLETYVQRNRVELTGRYTGRFGQYDLISFWGQPVVVDPKKESNGWVPKKGESCRVVGRLKRFGREVLGKEGKIEFVVIDAKYSPSESI